MKIRSILIGLMLLAAVAMRPCSAERPNILLILADDLGYSDLQCYGGEIRTPVLNQLANDGIRFSSFYNTGRCWPTRACLMTGYYAPQVRRDRIPGYKGGGHGRRPEWAKTLPELLKPAGYRSYHSGKWHIDRQPVENGFDLSYRVADHDRFFGPRHHLLNDQKLPPVAPDASFYTTTEIAEHAIQCLKQHKKDQPAKPFLSFVAFTSPHFPLHALPEDIAKYERQYASGWEDVRDRRWKNISKLDFLKTSLSDVERNVGPPLHFPKNLDKLGEGEVFLPSEWQTLSPAQQQFQATKMRLHAAMIDRMDQEIGRIIQQLKEMNEFENTLILFLSDNGASAEIMVRGDGHDPNASAGSAKSFLCLGPGWSTVANTPFRRHKTWVHEGGISTPLIAHWPEQIKQKGVWSNHVGHVIDVVPTVLEISGVENAISDQQPDYPGRSFLECLKSGKQHVDRELWWSHMEHRALRMGDFKLVSLAGGDWELYDLSTDRGESSNLMQQHPQVASEMIDRWQALAEEFAKDAGLKSE